MPSFAAIPEQLKPNKLHQEMQKIRSTGQDITLAEHLACAYPDVNGIPGYYAQLGVDPLRDTIQSLLMDKPDDSIRWLVPEIIRDAIRKGYVLAPIVNDFIIRDEAIAQPSQIMPYWNMTGLSNEPKALNAAESFEMGTVSYGSKTVHISKTGIGLELTDECIRYTNVSLLSLWLQDVGVKLGSALSRNLITCLINGDQSDASEAAGVRGVASSGTLAYGDLISVFVRGALLNRQWTKVITTEAMANVLLAMTEFRNTDKFGNPELGLNLKTPIPSSLDVYVHSSAPTDKLVMVDPRYAVVKLTSVPLTVESDRIVNRQINGTYVSLTTGFAIIFRDGRIILTKAGTDAFPSWMAPVY